MSLVDIILNIVGLLLWFNWRAVNAPKMAAPGVGLTSTLRPAGPPSRRWALLGGLFVLLALRAFIYWQIGPPVDWVPRIALGPTTLSFSSDFLARMLLFSALSFAVTLGIVYLWILLLSVAAPRNGDAGRRFIRTHLGMIDRWPAWTKALLPLLLIVGAWCALHPLLWQLGLTPAAPSGWRLAGQGAVIGLEVYLTLKFLLLVLFSLHMVNSYVYLGEMAVWKFINTTAQQLLRPMQWLPLKLGRIDLTPAVVTVAIFIGAEFGQRGLARLYERLL